MSKESQEEIPLIDILHYLYEKFTTKKFRDDLENEVIRYVKRELAENRKPREWEVWAVDGEVPLLIHPGYIHPDPKAKFKCRVREIIE